MRRLPQRTIVSGAKGATLHSRHADTVLHMRWSGMRRLPAYRDMALPPGPMSVDNPPGEVAAESILNIDLDLNLHGVDPDGDILNPTF